MPYDMCYGVLTKNRDHLYAQVITSYDIYIDRMCVRGTRKVGNAEDRRCRMGAGERRTQLLTLLVERREDDGWPYDTHPSNQTSQRTKPTIHPHFLILVVCSCKFCDRSYPSRTDGIFQIEEHSTAAAATYGAVRRARVYLADQYLVLLSATKQTRRTYCEHVRLVPRTASRNSSTSRSSSSMIRHRRKYKNHFIDT